MTRQVSEICKSASYSLWKIGRIRQYLDKKSAEKLIHAFVTSKLDYCNSVLIGMPNVQLTRLQSIQNSAARLVMRAQRHDHITPILHDLHWLPVSQRITFKVLLIVFKALHGMAPAYISDLLTPYAPSRTLRSSQSNLLSTPSFRTKFYGSRAFSVAAPSLWNALPASLRAAPSLACFKTGLKTHLFNQHFI